MHVRERLRTEAPVVIDASVAVQWFAPEPGSDDAALLLRTDALFLAPDIMLVEATNAWWKKYRRGEMAAGQVGADQRAGLAAVGVHSFMAPATRPRTSQRCSPMTISTGGRLARIEAAAMSPHGTSNTPGNRASATGTVRLASVAVNV